MERVDAIDAERLDDGVGAEERLALERADAEEGEATGQTGDRSEQRLERLGEMMRDEVPAPSA